ncbi:MAG: phosphoribosylformylglycinamidine synthase, purS protein [Bdellovibrionales bacterium CG10_big_fil_rev_8_21_14_0_10_45_34]|nr:MAG: phosphoribosylformylglycinamidine synthase, purS protein [Bdellovibrionales bacterium CG10_big_fil_rev_8_21_14_0_10_45_34]
MKLYAKVMPRKEVLDTQGRAVENVLKLSGFELKSCRVGKLIEVDLSETNREAAEEKLRKMSEYVLFNPLIETLEIESLP